MLGWTGLVASNEARRVDGPASVTAYARICAHVHDTTLTARGSIAPSRPASPTHRQTFLIRSSELALIQETSSETCRFARPFPPAAGPGLQAIRVRLDGLTRPFPPAAGPGLHRRAGPHGAAPRALPGVQPQRPPRHPHPRRLRSRPVWRARTDERPLHAAERAPGKVRECLRSRKSGDTGV